MRHIPVGSVAGQVARTDLSCTRSARRMDLSCLLEALAIGGGMAAGYLDAAMQLFG